MSNVETIKMVELSGGTSSDIHRRLQEKAMTDKVLGDYDIDTIDFTVEEFSELFNESGLVNSVSESKQGTLEWDFINLKSEYWTDKPLKFEKKDENGVFLIKQQDENGNWVAMGWTTEKIAVDYMYRANGGGTHYVTKSDKISQTKDEELVKIDDKVSEIDEPIREG